MSQPDWSLYRTFLAVLDAGSLSAAARQLNIAQPTVGRQIEALEAALGGEALFTRSPGGLGPTRTARTLEPHARAMAAAAETLKRAAIGDATSMTGVVRVTASDVVGAEILPSILTAFREDHPLIDIELVLSNRQEDLLRRDADIAVRMARPTQDALLARRIGTVPMGFYGHRSYLQKHGEPRSLDALTGHTLIGFDRIRPDLQGLSELPFEVTREIFALRSDSDLTQLALLRAAAGEAQAMSGVIRLSASDVIGVEVLPALLADFRETWPAIDIELNLTNRQEDLLRRDADMAVRMARPTQDALLARRIGSVELIFHGHRSYLQKHGEPRTIEELLGHTLIGFDRVRPDMEGIRNLPMEVTREMFALRCDNEPAQIALIRAGAGLAPCQRAIAARDPNLVPILEGVFSIALEMWVVMHEDLKGDRRLRALFDHLVEGLGQYVRSG